MLKTIVSLGGILFFACSAYSQDYVPGEVIVKFKDNQAGQPNFSSKAVGGAMNLKKSWEVLNTHKFQMKAGQQQSVEQMVQMLNNDPNVEYAEPNFLLYKQGLGVEGQSLNIQDIQNQISQSVYSKGMTTFSGGGAYFQSDADIQAVDAWAVMSPPGPFTPVVAIIDTGVDYSHEVFTDADAIWSNADEIPGNGIDDDGNGYIDDTRGWNFVGNNNDPMDDENHGTHCAGIVLGASQDIFANPVTSARVKIMPLKFLDSNGSGATSDAIEAIYYAINNGATVINASWGGGSYSSALIDALVASYNAKVSFVAAAGNMSLNNDQSPTYPANYGVPNVISIAASSDFDVLASFSNYGKGSVHISSPGVSILSTLPNDSYGYASGTSMAAPLVAGIVALMQSEEGKAINGYQAKEILFGNNDTQVGNLAGKVMTDGRVNVLKAVNYVKANSVSDYQPDFDQSMLRIMASTGGGSSGGCGLVKQIMKNNKGGGNGGGGAGGLFGKALLMLIILSPFILAMALKQNRREIENRRDHERYNISSEVRINVGSRELVGNVSSISLGGVKIDTEALLENGGIIEMNIMSPDGKDKIQAVGRVVWSAEQKSYGVKFCDIADAQTSTISKWTKKLVKAS